MVVHQQGLQQNYFKMKNTTKLGLGNYLNAKNVNNLEKENNMKSYKAQGSKKNNFLILLIVGILSVFAIGFTSASISDLGFYSPNSCVQLIQFCSSGCTFNNISSIYISHGGGTPTINSYNPSLAMNSLDGNTYNTSFCQTQELGTYFINGIGNDGGTQGSWTYQFEIGLPMWMIITFLVFAYGLTIIGFFVYRNEWVSMLGGMIMAILGLYLTSFGIGIYNNTMTYAIGLITIVLGLMALLIPIGEKLEVDMNFFDRR